MHFLEVLLWGGSAVLGAATGGFVIAGIRLQRQISEILRRKQSAVVIPRALPNNVVALSQLQVAPPSGRSNANAGSNIAREQGHLLAGTG
jgi:hypothetical protein